MALWDICPQCKLVVTRGMGAHLAWHQSIASDGVPAPEPGEPGPQGPPGADSTVPGPQGPPGAASTVPGPAGPPGAASTVPGPAGSQGSPGTPGADGVAGAQGIQGVKGDTGNTGPAGAASTVPGPQGLQGIPGTQGIQGAPGVDAVHTFAAPVALTGSAPAAGVLTTLARSDHLHPMPKKRYRCTANTAVSTTAFAAITGLPAHALAAGKVYEIRALVWYTAAAATTGPRPSLIAAGGLTATDFQLVGVNQISATTAEMFRSTALGTAPAFTASVVAGGLLVLEAVIKVNVAGTVQLQMGSEVAASAITVQAGSYMTVEEVAE